MLSDIYYTEAYLSVQLGYFLLAFCKLGGEFGD